MSVECQWDCPPGKHHAHCFLSEERQSRMSDAYRDGMPTALTRPCRTCNAQPNERCTSDVILRATGQPFGELRDPHLARVLG